MSARAGTIAKLDEQGRCCGRKPIRYRGINPRLFCTRCCAEFDPATGLQRPNWAWKAGADDGLQPTYPAQEYANRIQP